MSLFGSFFTKPRGESAVLISIGSEEVSGAYAHYKEGELPLILYTKTVLVESRSGESGDTAAERALESLASYLLSEGAPALHRHSGSGAAETILVSIDAPWQHVAFRTEKIEPGNFFVFTHALVGEKLALAATIPAGHVLVDESLAGTLLNGYEVREPFGKRATQAVMLIIASSIVRTVAEKIALVLRRSYHTKNIHLIAGPSLRYQAIRLAFPVERDCLLVDTHGPETTLALVRQGILVELLTFENVDLPYQLIGLLKKYPAPSTIFLLGTLPEERMRSTISETHAKVVTLTGQHLHGLIRTNGDAGPTLSVSLMALYAQTALINERLTE